MVSSVIIKLLIIKGGTNFRVLKITIDSEKQEISQDDKPVKIPDEVKKSDAVTLFNFIADALIQFVREQKIQQKLPLGFTFSFPVHQTGLTAGTLIQWTKDFTADGVVGEDIISLLRAAVNRRKVQPAILTV